MNDQIVVFELEVQQFEQVPSSIWADSKALWGIVVGVDVEESIGIRLSLAQQGKQFGVAVVFGPASRIGVG